MARPFKGTINLDIRDSKPDWAAFLADKAPKDAPNVLVILYDDTGLAAFTKERMGEYNESHGSLKLYVDDKVVAEGEIRTMTGHFSLCGEGLCVGYDSSDPVSSEYGTNSHFTGGTITKVVFDVADDAYVDVERHMHAALARD